MPVILAEVSEASWLDSATKPDQLREILVGLSPPGTSLRPVSTAVNDARYDGPECLAEPAETAQSALF
jgi:putative SOS response-associated peptidase YedK